MENCMERSGAYLGSWFIRRCIWSIPAYIKKFAKSMLKRNGISRKDYENLLWEITEYLPK